MLKRKLILRSCLGPIESELLAGKVKKLHFKYIPQVNLMHSMRMHGFGTHN